MKSFLLLTCLLGVVAVSQAAFVNNIYAASTDPAKPSPAGTSPYRAWPSSTINFKFKADARDYAALKAAMDKITADMAGCIVFKDVTFDPTFTTGPFLDFRSGQAMPSLAGTPLPACYSMPGYFNNPQQNQGQVVVIWSDVTYPAGAGAGACMNTGNSAGALPYDRQRDAMRILANALGLRNEWMKPTRTTLLTGFPSGATPPAALDTFMKTNAPTMFAATTPADQALDLKPTVLDTKSITMITGQQFSQGGTTALFTFPAANPAPTTFLPRLSQLDCQALQILYPTCAAGGAPLPATCTSIVYP